MELSAVASLTPEERAALKAALDKAEEPDDVTQLWGLVGFLCNELEAMRESHDALKKLVTDEIIGGLSEAYESNVRTERMGEFKGKYGSMLDPLAEPFKRTFGADLHDKAFDYLDGMRGDEGYTDEVGESKLKEVIQQIKEKLGIAEPAAVVAEVKEEPAAPAAEEGEAEEEPEADAQAAWNEIEAMKRRDDKRDTEREKRQPRRKGA